MNQQSPHSSRSRTRFLGAGAAILALSLAVVLGLEAATPEPVLALKGLDPVALAQGREVAGREELEVVDGPYRYRFENEASRASFRAERDRYAIQLGGGCGRMGPLSGLGSPDRFLVHNGRTYIFASDSCRSSFAKAPERYLEGDDAPPEGDGEARRRGTELLERAVKAVGGETFDKVGSVALDMTLTYGEGEKAQIGSRRVVIGREVYLLEERWGDWVGAEQLLGARATRISGQERWEGDSSVRSALVRGLYREPLALLAARHQPGFVAVAMGVGELAGRPVEKVAVGFRGATSTLSLDPETGRVLAVSFRGRGGPGLGTMEHAYSDFRLVNGLVLPWAVATTFDTQPVTEPKVNIRRVEVSFAH